MRSTVQIIDLKSNGPGDTPEPESGTKKVSKFVIIRSQDLLQLVHGPIDEYAYHADLVKKYCDLNSIPSGWLKKPDLYEIYGNSHHIKGGGWLEEKPGEKSLRVFGYSTAYGRFEYEDMAYLSQRARELSDYDISIDD